MIPRYTRAEMAVLWSEEAKFQRWLDIELAHCRAMKIPADDLAAIESKARIDVDRISKIEERTHHDVIAFLESLEEMIGPPARFIHLGLTSTDVVDTAIMLTLGRAIDLLARESDGLSKALREKALQYKTTISVGRTHGMHAEPTTFGMKFALWWDEFRRHRARLDRLRSLVRCGKLSGAVGTYAETTPELEATALAELGLTPAPIATQILSRDLHAEILTTLAIIAGTIEKIAVEIRHLQRTEVGEAAEPFAQSQKGSSAMPHKRNPVVCERLTGLARVIRAHAGVALENQALWHERDISHSSAERIIFADSFCLIDYMLVKATWVIEGLTVNQTRITENLRMCGNQIYSSRALATALRRGEPRSEAYSRIQLGEIDATADNAALLETVGKIYLRLGIE